MEGNLESALRRAAFWAPRGMPHTGAELLAGTKGRLRFRNEPGDLYARLPSGEEVYVALSTRNERVFITRIDRDYRVEASADLPSHWSSAPGERRHLSLAGALAVAFAHGPLAGISPAFVATRDGVTFTRRISWAF